MLMTIIMAVVIGVIVCINGAIHYCKNILIAATMHFTVVFDEKSRWRSGTLLQSVAKAR